MRTTFTEPMLTVDDVYGIMIHLDIQDLQALCSTGQLYEKLCIDSNFWRNKILYDKLPLFNHPKSLQDYLKIENAKTLQTPYLSISHLKLKLTDENLSLIIPSQYEQLKHLSYDRAELFLNYYRSQTASSLINFIGYKDDKKTLKSFKSTRQEILDIIFRIGYYYPYLLKDKVQ